MSNIGQVPASIMTKERYDNDRAQKIYDTEQALGRDAFLKLFTTQLTNQNPLEPMNNEAFVSQLAQFSSLESMKGMQTTMEDVATSIHSSKFANAGNMLGRYVSNAMGVVAAGAGHSGRAVTYLPEEVDSVSIRAFDAAGNEVYEETKGRQPRGEMSIAWNGEDAGGNPLAYDAYKIMVTATYGGMVRSLPVKGLERIEAIHWDATTQDWKVETDTGRQLNSSEITTVSL